MKKIIALVVVVFLIFIFILGVGHSDSPELEKTNSTELASVDDKLSSADEMSDAAAVQEPSSSETLPAEETAVSETTAAEEPTQAPSSEPYASTSAAQKNTDNKATEKTSSAYIPQNTQTEKTVYITPYGKRYHYDGECGGKNSRPVSISEAKQTGLTPCQKCVY